MEKTIRWLAWSGPMLVITFLLGFWLSGYLMPNQPTETALETAQWYQVNTIQIRLGLLITMFSASLFAPWSIAIMMQIKRIDEKLSPLAYLQAGLGLIFVLEFIFPLMIWQAAAYRPEGNAEIIQRLHDLGWLMFLGVVSTAVMQAIVIGIAILSDKKSSPVFPRWVGYFNIWITLLFMPGSLVVFFKSGPFAWNGLFAWWLLAAAFCVWVVVMSAMVLQTLGSKGDSAD